MIRRLSLRTRLALMSAIAVTIAIAVVSTLAWWATADSLRSQVDRTLTAGPGPGRQLAGAGVRPLRAGAELERLCTADPGLDRAVRPIIGSIQLVRADGTSCSPNAAALVPVRAADLAAARGGPRTALRSERTADGTHVRVISTPLGAGYALMTSRDLTEVDNALESLGLVLLVAGTLGALGALALGLIVARAGLRPVDGLTLAAEKVAATKDLDVRIPVTGDDEVARLARAFNKMTAALASARDRREQVIADAGHELRTPLTSLRTNVELLLRSETSARQLSAADRADLLRSLAAQLAEFSHLTSELSLLAHEDPRVEPVEVRLDDVVRSAVERASLRGDHVLRADLQPWTLTGDPAALERAVLNLLDNAVKFSPPGSTVLVRLGDGLLEVLDEGCGIPEPERPQVFERFWRSPSARAMPGSGLGLAIVADVAESHGGQVWAAAAPSGGAAVSLRLPGHA